MSKNIIVALVSTIIILLGAEGLLRLFDPWGAVYFDDLYDLFDHLSDDDLAPVLEPGFYDLRVYDATVLHDHTRLVPDSNRAGACIIVALGDSQTFGMGINDDQTWVNQLALLFGDTHFINAGVPGYFIDDGLVRKRYFPEADAFIYLVIENDTWDKHADPAIYPGGAMLSKYVTYALFRWHNQQRIYDMQAFESNMKALRAINNVLVATPYAFDGFPEDLTVLSVERHTVSLMDGHGSPRWHRDVALALQPYVRNLIEDHCG